MRAILRWKAVLLAGGLTLLPASALAQETARPATTNTPAPATVGPSELQNFSLSGNVARPSAQQPAPPATSAAPAPADAAAPGTANAAPRISRKNQSRPSARIASATVAPAPVPKPLVQAPPASTGAALPLLSAPAAAAPAPSVSAGIVPEPTVQTGTLAPQRKLSILPWLVAALALAAGTLFLLWRRRPRVALAGAPQFDLLKPPEPAPPPVPPGSGSHRRSTGRGRHRRCAPSAVARNRRAAAALPGRRQPGHHRV